MKKTLLALAVAAVATSASAATVYKNDTSKVDVSGSVRVALGKFGDEQRGDLRNDGSRLWVKAEHDLQNGLKALGGLELRFDNIDNYDSMTSAQQAQAKAKNTFANPRVRQLFAGLALSDVGQVTFGKQETTLDSVQLSDFTYIWGGNNNLNDFADKSIKFKSAEWSGFSFGLDYAFGRSNKDRSASGSPDAKLKYGYGASLFYSNNFTDDLALNLAAGYGVDRKDDDRTTNTVAKDTSWRTSAQIVYGPASFGVEYGQTVSKENGVKTETNKSLLVGAKYQVMEPTDVYVQWQRNQEKDELISTGNKETENVYIVGADYKFSNNVVTFVEYAHLKTKDNANPVNKSKESKYAVGLRVYF
ncbi:porin [Avibacterium volantium]|uniref:Porin OmpF n=1 Tax=Avibacterium volantium TaxID=762 RepID=A0A447SQ59_AVIVO|nr:porin [Avibacterium volantium]VEB23526.1 Porin OmpF [Avibacterium volantium]